MLLWTFQSLEHAFRVVLNISEFGCMLHRSGSAVISCPSIPSPLHFQRQCHQGGRGLCGHPANSPSPKVGTVLQYQQEDSTATCTCRHGCKNKDKGEGNAKIRHPYVCDCSMHCMCAHPLCVAWLCMHVCVSSRQESRACVDEKWEAGNNQSARKGYCLEDASKCTSNTGEGWEAWRRGGRRRTKWYPHHFEDWASCQGHKKAQERAQGSSGTTWGSYQRRFGNVQEYWLWAWQKRSSKPESCPMGCKRQAIYRWHLWRIPWIHRLQKKLSRKLTCSLGMVLLQPMEMNKYAKLFMIKVNLQQNQWGDTEMNVWHSAILKNW